MRRLFRALLIADRTPSIAIFLGCPPCRKSVGRRNPAISEMTVRSSTTPKCCQAKSCVPDFIESGWFSFLVFLAHTIFSLPILHTKKIPANLKKFEPYQWRVEAVEPPEYEPEHFGVLDRSSRSSGFWVDSFISDDDDELHYKPAMGSYVEIFADSSIEERRHFVMGLEHGMRTRYWPGGRLRGRSYYKDGNYHGYELLE